MVQITTLFALTLDRRGDYYVDNNHFAGEGRMTGTASRTKRLYMYLSVEEEAQVRAAAAAARMSVSEWIRYVSLRAVKQ